MSKGLKTISAIFSIWSRESQNIICHTVGNFTDLSKQKDTAHIFYIPIKPIDPYEMSHHTATLERIKETNSPVHIVG